ncbi:uncharacterized protein LOC119107214 [Pollicipes pollicipes]|uniref:uncharacterized protein LOC119107214 n=1 Tax=Pollicipes pollicipes TaxID=41117 RepID=UPI001885937B|nr:uncharacterized protein LOC119107214 [Pollicipes pollicipes]
MARGAAEVLWVRRPAPESAASSAGVGRGLLHKFLTSRGQLCQLSSGRRLSPPQRRLETRWSVDGPPPAPQHQQVERRSSGPAVNRRILSAEEKIQLELKSMKEREDELRRERSWALARSQPDLLAALEEPARPEEPAEPPPPPAGPLSRTRSNPSLLDEDEQISGKHSDGKIRKALINQWESRTQGTEI